MRPSIGDFLTLIAVGFVLLLADRYLRIEGFANPKSCGVGMPSCSNGTRCMNGFCQSDKPPHLPPTTLPVFP
jgi:hypothetical protein